jgi:hypothetical protein
VAQRRIADATHTWGIRKSCSKPMNRKGWHGFLRVAETRAANEVRAQTEVCATGPRPFFSELHILKDFKSSVLKLRILQGLQARFAEVRIVKELGMWGVGCREEEKHGFEDPPLQKRGKSRGAEASHLHRRGERLHRKGKTGGGKEDLPDCEALRGSG